MAPEAETIVDRTGFYCIIGAGPAGMIAARSLKNAGIAYEQMEKNPDVGGIWDIRNDWSPMYESAHFISSKTISNLPGYPMPEHYPDYPSHALIFQYLRAFARDNGLYPHISFNTSVEHCEREGDHWLVRLSTGEIRRYRGLFICNGNTWDPSMPSYPGEFTGEVMHSVAYERGEQFKGRRVLVVGAGNSGCDIACDASLYADAAFISMRRGYHFVPKYIMGIPADKFAAQRELPLWLEQRLFSGLLKLVVGDLTQYGLQPPDHRLMESHPIMNTQLLHHLGHGDIRAQVGVKRLDGNAVHFVDGSQVEVDLIVYATGYKVTYPFLDHGHFDWISKYPDLFLSSLHREYDNLACLGLHQTDGGAFDFFGMQADMMANYILDQAQNPTRAAKFKALKASARPDLTGGMNYVKSPRHATYVKKNVFAKYCQRLMKDFGWRSFGLERAVRASPIPQAEEQLAPALG